VLPAKAKTSETHFQRYTIKTGEKKKEREKINNKPKSFLQNCNEEGKEHKVQ